MTLTLDAALWPPSATLPALQQRARLLAVIRSFFAERRVMEVETPLMSHYSVTDPHLHPFISHYQGPGGERPLFLQTSPEYHMKRLLAAGSGAIYQLFRACRNEEHGRNHNTEFTLLEWYRPGFDDEALIDEVDLLLQTTLGCQPAERLSYQQAFVRHTGLCPLEASLTELRAIAPPHCAELAAVEEDRDTLLQLLFAACVEPQIGQQRPCAISRFPASQAALARVCPDDPRVAARFEFYFKGIELANGFYELTDASEQRARFAADNAKRAALGRQPRAADEWLLAALAHGLPDCAGVALGVDRLLMLALGAQRIDEVLAFPLPRA